MEAIILAGGQGTRLRSVVPDLPKPMAPINGRPFLEYLLDLWVRRGIRRVVLSVGYKWESIMRYFGVSYRDAQIEYAVEPSPLGTGGGLALAGRYLKSDGDFLLLNGDTYFDVGIAALARQKQRTASDAAIALFETGPGTRFSPMHVCDDWQIRGVVPGNRSGGLANGGVYLIDRRLLAGIAATGSLETDLLPHWLALGRRICGMKHVGRFIDIGVPQDYQQAVRVLARDISNEALPEEGIP